MIFSVYMAYGLTTHLSFPVPLVLGASLLTILPISLTICPNFSLPPPKWPMLCRRVVKLHSLTHLSSSKQIQPCLTDMHTQYSKKFSWNYTTQITLRPGWLFFLQRKKFNDCSNNFRGPFNDVSKHGTTFRHTWCCNCQHSTNSNCI